MKLAEQIVAQLLSEGIAPAVTETAAITPAKSVEKLEGEPQQTNPGRTAADLIGQNCQS